MRRLLVLALLVCSSAVGQEAMFRGNAQRSGVYGDTGLPQFNKVRWQFHTGAAVFSSPVVSGGTLYVGSDDHFLYALDRNDGTLKWKFKTGARITSTPAVSAGAVYFLSYDDNFYALDAGTGALKWKFKTGGERRYAATHLHGSLPVNEVMPDPFDFFLSSPAVWGGKVYFGSGDANIYALDVASGELKWKFKTGDVVHASPAISDGVVLVGSWDSYFYALDATSGKEKWRFKTGEDPDIHNQVGIQSSAAVADGVAYFGCRDSKFYAVDVGTGKQLWAFSNDGSWVITSPAVKAGKVFFATSDSGLFYELDAGSGKPVFSLKFNSWPMFSSPAIAGDSVLIGSHQGKLLSIDRGTHKVAWEFETESAKKSSGSYTSADGTPNYRAVFSDIFYDDMVSGVQKMMSFGAILSSPVVADKTVYVGSADGNVYALM